MAHYALLDGDSIVTQVITGIDEDDTSTLPSEFSSWEEFYGDQHGKTCKRTSYNTFGNQHSKGGTAYRGNYAGKGYTYDETNDVFIAPKPVEEGWTFTLNTTTWLWEGTEDE